MYHFQCDTVKSFKRKLSFIWGNHGNKIKPELQSTHSYKIHNYEFVSMTLHGRTYSNTPGNELKRQLLQILKNCTNRGNRTITSGRRWQHDLKKRQRDEKEKIDNPKLIESAYYYSYNGETLWNYRRHFCIFSCFILKIISDKNCQTYTVFYFNHCWFQIYFLASDQHCLA